MNTGFDKLDNFSGDINARRFSMPSKPGEAFTSIINGPRLSGTISIPATFKPMICAARIAIFLSSSYFQRLLQFRRDANWNEILPAILLGVSEATTCHPRQNNEHRRRLLLNIFLHHDVNFQAEKAEHTACRLDVSTRITLMPCVPSKNLMTSGGPPTILIKS